RQQVTIDGTGNFGPLELALKAPDREGVFHWEFSLVNKRRLPTFQAAKPLLQRRLEFVALNEDQPFDSIAGWRPVASVEASNLLDNGILDWISLGYANPSAWENLSGRSPIERLGFGNSEPIVVGTIQAVEVPIGTLLPPSDSTVQAVNPASYRSMSKLECLEISADSWIAIPLGKLDPNTPHRLRLTLPAGVGEDLLVSLRCDLESETSGNRTERHDSIGNDYRIVANPIADGYSTFGHSDSTSSDRPKSGTKQVELLFWPSEDPNFLVFANNSLSNPAYIAHFGLEAAALEPNTSDASNAPAARVGIHIDKPLLASCFSSARTLDPESQSWLDSWSTFYASSTRLVQALEFSNANLLCLKVAADGGTLYPSDIVEPNLLFDNGAYFSDSRTPEIKDSVELLMRLCDRQGIQVLLSLDLDTPSKSLADYARSHQDSRLYQQQRGGSGSIHWNPLHPQVQQSARETVFELAERYASHPSFGGIQIQIDRSAHLTFYGDRWGYHPNDIAEFRNQRSSSIGRRSDSPKDDPSKLNAKETSLFLDWRARELAAFYQELAEQIQADAPKARLFLNLGRLWDERLAADDFEQPGIHARSPERFLKAIGIDESSLRQQPGIKLMGGAVVASEETIDAERFVYTAARESKLARLAKPFPAEADSTAANRQSTNLDTGSPVRNASLVHQQPDVVTLRADPSQRVRSVRLFPINISSSAPTKRFFQASNSDPFLSGAWLPNGHDLLELESTHGSVRTASELNLVWKSVFISGRQTTPQSQANRQQTYRLKMASRDGTTYLRAESLVPWRQTLNL
ncbi:MAG: family 10 glycosylhydrolase, partial [Planctomycetota bacterium]